MKTRELGRSGLRVSSVGLGCMGMSHAYGAPADRREMTELLAEAVAMGYTFFDTAEGYGTPQRPHDNEELLGEALRPYRDHIVLATKFGISLGTKDDSRTVVTDSRPEVIRRAVEGSLRRLHTDHIDLYYQHRMDQSVEPEVVADVMATLIREGKILHWGVSEASEEYVRRAHKVCPLTALFAFLVLCSFLSALLTYLGTECALTNKRVILKTGTLSRNALELRLSKCDSLRVDQGIFGRMFGYGTIVAMTGGATNRFTFIADPIGFRNAINEEANKAGY